MNINKVGIGNTLMDIIILDFYYNKLKILKGFWPKYFVLICFQRAPWELFGEPRYLANSH